VAGTPVAQGTCLDAVAASEPITVPGAAAAQRPGFDRVWPGMRTWVGGMWFSEVGILNPPWWHLHMRLPAYRDGKMLVIGAR